MSADYTGRHHETRIGVHRRDHRKELPVSTYEGRHRKADVEIALPSPSGRRKADLELTVTPSARRKPKEPVAKIGYTGQHTRKPKSQKKRADATSRQLDRKFGAGPGGLLASIWRLGAR